MTGTTIRLAAIAAALVACSPVASKAEGLPLPATMGVHLTTAHLGDAGAPAAGYNSANPGLYARWDSGLTLGAYYNSMRRPSAYAGWTWSDSADRFALTAGAVTGYEHAVDPLLVPSVRLGITDEASLRVALLLAPKASPAVHFSVEWRFR